jgi:hypothetical protein
VKIGALRATHPHLIFKSSKAKKRLQPTPYPPPTDECLSSHPPRPSLVGAPNGNPHPPRAPTTSSPASPRRCPGQAPAPGTTRGGRSTANRRRGRMAASPPASRPRPWRSAASNLEVAPWYSNGQGRVRVKHLPTCWHTHLSLLYPYPPNVTGKNPYPYPYPQGTRGVKGYRMGININMLLSSYLRVQ